MRLTCLKCGHQFDVAMGSGGEMVGCICGTQFKLPQVVDAGVQPSWRAAERSRQRAFRAAGLVRNVGGFAFGITLLGVLFFPLGLVGAAIGIYTLTMLRGPLGRYSGRRWAWGAIGLGVLVFGVEGWVFTDWLNKRRNFALVTAQQSASEDLKRLRRAQVLFRATNNRYGGFEDFRFRPSLGRYTLYLSPMSYFPGEVEGAEVVTPLPQGMEPGFSEAAFTAVAVANLDGDADLDVWMITAEGSPVHLRNDLDHLSDKELRAAGGTPIVPAETPEPAAGGAGGTGGAGGNGVPVVADGEEGRRP